MPDAKPTPQTQVVVSRAYYDSSVKAFKEVVALRDAIAKLQAQGSKGDVDRQALESLNAALNELISIKDQTIEAKDKLIQVYQQMYDIVTKMNEKLLAQLNKPKSMFDKIMTVLKDIALIAAGVTIGRGL